MKRWILSALALLVVAAPATAAPLDPAQVPADAKWVLHVDFDALRQTTLAAQVRQEKLNKPGAQRFLQWVRDRYGIDLQKDLHGATLYGSSYKRHQGIALLATGYDREKVARVIAGAPGYTQAKHGEHTLHTWQLQCPCMDYAKHARHGDHQADSGKKGSHRKDAEHHKTDKGEQKDDEDDDSPGDAEDKGDAHRDAGKQDARHDKHAADHGQCDRGKSPSADQKCGDHKHGDKHHQGPAHERKEDHGPHMVTTALLEGLIVLAPSPEDVQKTLDHLAKKAGQAAQSSALVPEKVAGAVFQGAAVDLAQLDRHGPKFAVLRQGERVSVALGERDKQAFYDARFEAKSAEVAQRIEKMNEGFKAMLQFQADAYPGLGPIVEGLKWNVEDRVVTVHWQADAQAVLDLAKHLKKHARAHWQRHWDAHRQGDYHRGSAREGTHQSHEHKDK